MNLIEKYFFKERRDALRIRFWRLVLKNSTSYPYLSGDAFAELCDYAAYGKDGTKNLNLRKLRRAKKLFVPGHKLNDLLQNHFEDISATVLICGNSDQNFITDPILPKSIKLWLCQNYAVENGFGRILPIGLENLRLGKSGFKRFHKRSKRSQVVNKVLVPPMQITNPIREELIRKCISLPNLFDVHLEYLGSKNYFELISEYKFVLVLEGNGFDTHRLWEVLYKGGIPVLLPSNWTRQILTLPFININDSLNDEAEIMSRMQSLVNHDSQNYDFLVMQYWKKYVDNYIIG